VIRSLRDLVHYTFRADDGDAGRVHDFYFEDDTWAIRYLVADTGRWLPGKIVLLPPQAIRSFDWKDRVVHLDVTREQIENSPAAVTDEPVSRQQEEKLFDHFGWRPYWYPAPLPMDQGPELAPVRRNAPEVVNERPPSPERQDPHLRSVQEILKYDVHCQDADCGSVADVAVDDDEWVIRYLVVDTHKWLPGRKVLVAPAWTERFDWSEERVIVDLTRQHIEDSPEFDPNQPINREYEERLYDFYGTPRYWAEEEREEEGEG
jgi:hypothetical protein